VRLDLGAKPFKPSFDRRRQAGFYAVARLVRADNVKQVALMALVLHTRAEFDNCHSAS